jgi:hypothetical protein
MEVRRWKGKEKIKYGTLSTICFTLHADFRYVCALNAVGKEYRENGLE